MIDPNSPLNYVRDNQRQAEIRELYYKVTQLENFLTTNVAVEAEAPTPIVLSPVVNYLDNSDFKLSVKEYDSGTNITDPCEVLDKWYTSTDLNYTKHDYTSTTPSTNAITETSTGVRWDPYRNVLVLDGGDRFATPLFDKYASPGNTVYFRMQMYHIPVYLGILSYSGDTVTGYYPGTIPFADDMLVSFWNNPFLIPDNGFHVKPNPVGFDEVLKIEIVNPNTGTITVNSISNTTFTFKLKRFTNDEYVTGMDSVTINPNEIPTVNRKVCNIVSRPHPETLIRVNVLEDDGTLPLTLMSETSGSPSVTKTAELVIPSTFDRLIGTISIEVVGSLVVPVFSNSFNRDPQWLQIRFQVGTSAATNIDIAPGTLFFDKIALSSTYGSWSPSPRDAVVALTCARTAPGDLDIIPGGGGGGIVALPPPPEGGGIEFPYLPGIPQIPPPSRGGLF